MTYLQDLISFIEKNQWHNFLTLWEEYVHNDVVDGPEVCQILRAIKNSDLSSLFGKIAETTIPIWEKIQQEEWKDELLRLILDLQTTQSPLLATYALNYLESHYGKDVDHAKRLRLVGLSGKQTFQGAITNYELLAHMNKGNFVFHTGGWGVGQVVESSLLQERVVLEFENISSKKDLSFEKAFKNLVYLPPTHFLARRFGNPDQLESEGKEDPLALLRLVLRDLGPKNAQEIREELCDLVIPEKDWAKWWQVVRTRAKKDGKIQVPESSKEPFLLLQEEISHDKALLSSLLHVQDVDSLITLVYQGLRDFPSVMKDPKLTHLVREKIADFDQASDGVENAARRLQMIFLLEDLFPQELSRKSHALVPTLHDIPAMVDFIEILAFKKRFLMTLRSTHPLWQSLFLDLLLSINHNQLKEYVFKELLAADRETLTKKLEELLHNMTLYPETFCWYFQKLVEEEDLPFHSPDHLLQFLEAYLILLHFLEHKEEYRDLVKKMFQFLTTKRFAVIRALIQYASENYLKEFLLLASKCHCFSKEDLLTLQSLAEVVHPAMATKQKNELEEEIIWTTADGLRKVQEKVAHLASVEMIDNAREIEAARAHGDLRENSEYKFALERRSRLQSELQLLTKQLNQARILSTHEVPMGIVGPGSKVSLKKEDGELTTYTLLGPWDADLEQNILALQSKFAGIMLGKKKGDVFNFQGKKYTVMEIKSFFD